MVYTPTWKKNLILFCGLFENLIFTGKFSSLFKTKILYSFTGEALS